MAGRVCSVCAIGLASIYCLKSSSSFMDWMDVATRRMKGIEPALFFNERPFRLQPSSQRLEASKYLDEIQLAIGKHTCSIQTSEVIIGQGAANKKIESLRRYLLTGEYLPVPGILLFRAISDDHQRKNNEQAPTKAPIHGCIFSSSQNQSNLLSTRTVNIPRLPMIITPILNLSAKFKRILVAAKALEAELQTLASVYRHVAVKKILLARKIRSAAPILVHGSGNRSDSERNKLVLGPRLNFPVGLSIAKELLSKQCNTDRSVAFILSND